MKAFFDMMYKTPTKVILFGAACTQVTDPVAKTSRIWFLTQLSYADTHPMFTNQNYPYFFRMVPSENEFNSPRIHLLKLFNWTQVGTLYQNKPRYALAHNKLLNDLEEAGITILDSQSFAKEVKTHLIKLKEKDARIILGNFDENWARKIFCEVFRLGLYGRKYQWLIVGMYEDQWWNKLDKSVVCSRWQIAQAFEGTISTDLLPLRTSNIRTVSTMTPTQYLLQYDQLRGKEYSRFHGYAYDGIWTTALALQAVARRLKEQGDGRGLEDFEYRSAEWGDMFATALNATSFEGVTGPVWFINNNRKGYVLLKQFQGGREVKIGEYDGVQNVLDLKQRKTIQWRGSGPPLDRTLSIIERMRVNLPIYSVLASIASCGIVTAICFLAINIRFRNQRNIKMSSPYLNNLIIIGCILTYTSVILLGLDSELTSEDSLRYVCSMRAWILMSGFTLAFGSMFSKTWRVHTIFTDIKLNRKAITDFQLISVVAVLLGIDIAIMVTWQILDPFYRETKKLPPVPHPTNQDSQIVPVMEYCKSDRMTLFLGAIYVYKGLLMVQYFMLLTGHSASQVEIIGCFLAWETRHVSIPALNDSKYIGMSVYNVVIMCVIGGSSSDDDDTSSMSSSQDEETNVSLSTDKERSRAQYLLINSCTPQSDRKSVSTVELELSSSAGRESPLEMEAIPLTELKIRRESGPAAQSSEQQEIEVSEKPDK
uniref:Gamma-aminobutyric acid type B receptor subunit 2 n=1 Tax=Strigamia maritima TaxID=126957 RepID=T1JBG0_STRMM